MKLRLALSTEQFLQSYSRALPHAVLVSGLQGIGLNTLARHMSSTNGRLLMTVSPESKTSSSLPVIPVERIRQLYVETRSLMEGANFVIIDDADAMNSAAQNALLKLLEEPNGSIHFILTSHAPDRLLPTIRSRSRKFVVPRISQLESTRLIKSLGVDDSLMQQRLLYVAEGLPAELTRLQSDGSNFRGLSERVQKARQFVEANAYQRVAMVVAMKDDRKEVLKLIEMIVLLLRKSLSLNPSHTTVQLIGHMVEASELIRANGNIRLHLTDVATSTR